MYGGSGRARKEFCLIFGQPGGDSSSTKCRAAVGHFAASLRTAGYKSYNKKTAASVSRTVFFVLLARSFAKLSAAFPVAEIRYQKIDYFFATLPNEYTISITVGIFRPQHSS